MSIASSRLRNSVPRSVLGAVLVGGLLLGASSPGRAQPADLLPSWNDTASKKAIVDFVNKVTKQGGADFIAPA